MKGHVCWTRLHSGPVSWLCYRKLAPSIGSWLHGWVASAWVPGRMGGWRIHQASWFTRKPFMGFLLDGGPQVKQAGSLYGASGS